MKEFANFQGLKQNVEEDASAQGKIFNQCCCPNFLKFKFLLSNVWIINENAECSFFNGPQNS